MNFTKEFELITNRKSDIKNAKIFILKNDKPKNMKIFPEEVGDILLNQYFEKLKDMTKDKEFVDYIPDTIEKSTLQVMPTDRIELWKNILCARNEFPLNNIKAITVDDYNVDGNTIFVDMDFQNNDKLYFLINYQRVAAWYRNSIHLKKQNGKFVQDKGEVLALTPYVDVVINNDICYIINEPNFNKIFKYDEVINNQVESHIDEIADLDFIGDTSSFISMLESSKRDKQAMAKILLQNRLDKIKKFKPNYIRKQIEEQSKLSFIQFNDDDTINVDKRSFRAIMDILRGKINLDLITKELNGVEGNE